MNSAKKAVFFDRDGVLNDTVDRGDNFFVLEKKVRFTAPWTYAEFHLRPRVAEILEKIKQRGFFCILITNQPDITYGAMKLEDHERIMADVRRLPLDDIYVCPHGRNDGCSCKKPRPGMLFAAAEKWRIDLALSFMVGDTASDVNAAKAAGCRSILIADIHNADVAADERVEKLEEIIDIVKK